MDISYKEVSIFSTTKRYIIIWGNLPYWCSCCTDEDTVASADERSIEEVTALHLGTLPHAPQGGARLSITLALKCFVLTSFKPI